MFFKHHRNTVNSVSLLIRRRLLSRLSCTEKQFILTRPYIRIQLSLVPFWLHSVFNGLERVALQGLFPEVKVPFHDFYQQHQTGRGTPNMLNPRNRTPLYTDGERYRSPLSVAACHQARRNGVVEGGRRRRTSRFRIYPDAWKYGDDSPNSSSRHRRT